MCVCNWWNEFTHVCSHSDRYLLILAKEHDLCSFCSDTISCMVGERTRALDVCNEIWTQLPSYEHAFSEQATLCRTRSLGRMWMKLRPQSIRTVGENSWTKFCPNCVQISLQLDLTTKFGQITKLTKALLPSRTVGVVYFMTFDLPWLHQVLTFWEPWGPGWPSPG